MQVPKYWGRLIDVIHRHVTSIDQLTFRNRSRPSKTPSKNNTSADSSDHTNFPARLYIIKMTEPGREGLLDSKQRFMSLSLQALSTY